MFYQIPACFVVFESFRKEKMGKRKGRRNNGVSGGNKTRHSNHQNKPNSFGNKNNQMELGLASKFTPKRNATENFDDDDFFASEIVEDVMAQAMYHYMLEGEELDEESFHKFFLENYMGKLIVECAKNQHWHHGRPYGFDTSSDDDDGIDLGFRSSNVGDEPPFFSYKQRRQNGFAKGKNKKGRFDDQVAVETLIKMLIIQRILEEERRRNKRFVCKSIIIVLLIVAFFIYYWWK